MNANEKITSQVFPGILFDLSVIPVKTDKVPFSGWKKYQEEIAPISHWKDHFNDNGYVGIITGAISGNLEILDFDLKNDPQLAVWVDFKKLIPQSLYDRLIIQTTPNKGYHLIYRCPQAMIEPNQVLAKAEDGKVVIETRGEGGYFCHHLKDYEVMQGQFDLLAYNCKVPVITPDERELLLTASRSLDRISKNKRNTSNSKEPAINEFNDKYDIIQIFLKHGWKIYSDDDEKVRLTRPDSKNPYSGYYFKDSKVFFCYSTSTPFRANQPYNHFQILQKLEGKDDYRTTLRLIHDLGFEVQGRGKKITSDDIAIFLNDKGVRYDSFRQDRVFEGEVISEMELNTIFLDMKKHFDREVARTRFDEVFKSKYIKQYNPINEFISKYEDRHPEGMFEQWLDCLHFKNEGINRDTVLHFLKKWYVGMIAQALGGKHPNEFFLTFLSIEQGIGKTYLLRYRTLPEELHDYIAEHSITFDDDFKVIMGQYILIVDDEMDGRTFNEEKTFKNILSHDVLITRRKYDRQISAIKRRCSFAGSGNNLNVVREVQNRRVIPVELAGIDRDKLNALDLIDLFMEAYHMYKNGYVYRYEYGDKPLLKQLDQDYIQQSDLDLLLDDMVRKPVDESDVYYLATFDIAKVLSTMFPLFAKRLNVPTVGKKMVERSFKSLRKGVKKISCFEVSLTSKIIHYLDGYCQSYMLNEE